MKSAFEKWDDFIRTGYQTDDWHDLYAADAQKMAGGFLPGDWDQLSEQWRRRPADWLYRCVYSLRGVDEARAAPILLEMLMVPNEQIARAALDSLRSMDWNRKLARPGPEVFSRLRELAESGTGDRDVIEQLQRKLAAGRE